LAGSLGVPAIEPEHQVAIDGLGDLGIHDGRTAVDAAMNGRSQFRAQSRRRLRRHQEVRADPAAMNSSKRAKVLMGRRTLNRRELRAEVEAAEARGITNQPERTKAPRDRPAASKRTKPVAGPRMRVVWAVCDIGGRTVATFDYTAKVDAETLVSRLKAQGKGTHFVRSLKQPMEPDSA
jgi:hypothetical protein